MNWRRYESTALPIPSCPYCGATQTHGPESCPNVRAVDYYPDGSIKRVEKQPPIGAKRMKRVKPKRGNERPWPVWNGYEWRYPKERK